MYSSEPRGIPTVQTPLEKHRAQLYHLAQICFFSAATGNAFTIVFAGLAFTLVSLPNMTLTPALVAGLVRVFRRQRPGTVNTPVFFTSWVAMATRLLITSEHAFCFKPCSVASDFVMAPLVIAFPPAFIDFMGGNMLLGRTKKSQSEEERWKMRCT